MNIEVDRHQVTSETCRNTAVETRGDFAEALIEGLSARNKSIPCRFFYDAAGSELFERITELPEYYPTRTETAILRAHAGDMAALAAPDAVLIEFGSGSSTKTELLLARMRDLYAYVPIDISGAALRDAQTRIAARFPGLNVLHVQGDFARPLSLAPDIAARPRLGFFPGSTIGNLTEGEAVKLLANMRGILGDGSRLIIGADLKKDVRRLLAAYDDAAGVTAAFNLNLLHRANRELGADFDVDRFSHAASYDVRHGRIDMHLVSRAEQSVTVLGHRFRFATGERIHTEHSHKYDVDGFQALAQRAGWRPQVVWTDAERLFSVHVLSARQ
jgi:dimethylhistidine N-methyltransferase